MATVPHGITKTCAKMATDILSYMYIIYEYHICVLYIYIICVYYICIDMCCFYICICMLYMYIIYLCCICVLYIYICCIYVFICVLYLCCICWKNEKYDFFVSNDLAPSVSNGTLLCLARLSAQNVNLHSAEESLKTAGCATNYWAKMATENYVSTSSYMQTSACNWILSLG